MGFGFNGKALSAALNGIAGKSLTRLGREQQSAMVLGMGTVQVDSLGAWMRFAGLIKESDEGVALTDLGRAMYKYDPRLADPATWWVLHWEGGGSDVEVSDDEIC